MKRIIGLYLLLCAVFLPVTVMAVVVEDYEGTTAPLLGGTQVQAISSITLSTDMPFSGRQCAAVHYVFAPVVYLAQEQLRVPVGVRVNAPMQRMSVAVRGDNGGSLIGLRVLDASGECHQYGL
ncbi:MAG TPA: hypothetical protein VHV83_04020, partial [Armatimonadota bacterium]|nr:hypothetical protein [Armatimonadota bacterium]